MAIEAKRGCGYRKVGGLYLVSGIAFKDCDRLPFPLDVCPCCGHGIKFSRGWTWIEPNTLFGGDHHSKSAQAECTCEESCPTCNPSIHFPETPNKFDQKAGLIWIGAQHYKTTSEFMREGMDQGFSRRIKAIPRGFQLGKTWVFFAHIKAVGSFSESNGNGELFHHDERPGIFSAFKPERIERIVLQSEYDLYVAATKYIAEGPPLMADTLTIAAAGKVFENKVNTEYDETQAEIILRLKSDTDKGITLVPVPDEDKDHQ